MSGRRNAIRGRQLYAAYAGGVTTAISAPLGSSLVVGQSAAFAVGVGIGACVHRGRCVGSPGSSAEAHLPPASLGSSLATRLGGATVSDDALLRPNLALHVNLGYFARDCKWS